MLCCQFSSPSGAFYILINLFITSGILYALFLPRVTGLQQKKGIFDLETRSSQIGPPRPPGPPGPSYYREPCKDMCNKHRPSGSTNAFSINCKDSMISNEEDYYYEFAIRDCKDLCYYCGSKEICDFRVEPYVINCASTENLLFFPCKDICDAARDVLITADENALEALSFSCHDSNVYQYPFFWKDNDTCKQACIECQESICDSDEKELKYTCPAITALGGGCKRQCDYRRPEGFFGSYSFSCENKTIIQTDWDFKQCRRDCLDCPAIVCDIPRYFDGYYHDEFNCIAVNESNYTRPPPPPAEPSYDDSDCERRCDKSRPRNRKDDGENDGFYFECSIKHRYGSEEWRKCRFDCFTCPLEICDPYETVSAFYRCPQSKPTPPPPAPKPGSFIVSWTIIALISMAVIACIIATGFYGRKNTVERVAPIQSQPINQSSV